jgi:hypothetical protein
MQFLRLMTILTIPAYLFDGGNHEQKPASPTATKVQASKRYNGARFQDWIQASARICELRKAGFLIDTVTKSPVARYRLTE